MRELSISEIENIHAGFSWRDLAAAMGQGAVGGAATGAVAGAAGGTAVLPGGGTAVGAFGVGAIGAVGGALIAGMGYLVADLILYQGC